MAPKKSRQIKRKAATSLGAFLLAPITLPDIKLNALTLPLVKLEYCDGNTWYPIASESWVNATAPGTVTSITAGTGLNGGTITSSGTIALTSTGVLPGSYTNLNATVGTDGRLTSASNGSASGTITLGGAVTGSGNIGSTIITSLNSNQNPVSTFLNFNWTNSGSFAEYSCYNWLQESIPSPQFVYAVLAGSFGSNTVRGWQFIFQPNALDSLGNFQIDYYNQVSGRQTPFQISSSSGSLRTYVRTTLDMQNNSIINCSLDINTGTTGQLNISRLNGYPTNSSYFLRGDGIWTTPTFSSIDINTGTTGQLNISRLSGYPASSNAFLRGDGTWSAPPVPINIPASNLAGYPNNAASYLRGDGVWSTTLNVTTPPNKISGYPTNINYTLRGDSSWGLIFGAQINGYPNNAGYVFCGDNNWRPTPQAIPGYTNDPAKVLKGNGTWNYIQYVPLSSLQGYNNAWNYVPCGDSNWRTIAEATPVGSFPLNRLGGYPNNWRYIPCGDSNWRPTAQTIEGYTNDPAKVLKGNGTWNYIQYVPLSSLQGYNNAWNYVPCGDSNWRTIAEATPVGSFPLNRLGGYPNNWRYIPCGDSNWRPTAQTIEGYTNDPAKVLKGNGTWNYIQYVPLSSLQGYPNNSSYFLRGDGIWTTPTFSGIDINTGTTGQLNISRLNGYPASSNAFLRGDGTWILPSMNNLNINGNVWFSNYNLTTSGVINATTGTLQANNLAAYNSNALVVRSPLFFHNVLGDPISVTTNRSTNVFVINNTNLGATATGLFIQKNGVNAVDFGFNNSTSEAYVWAGVATIKFGTTFTKRMEIASNSAKTTFHESGYQCYIRPYSNHLDLRAANVYNSSYSTIFESNALGETSSLVMNGDFMQFINPLDVLGFIFTDEDAGTMTSYVAYINSSGQFITSSRDQKHSILKKEHKDYLDRLNRLNVYSYGLKYEVLKSDSPKKKARKKRKMNELQVGVIAEDVLELFDNATNVYKPLDVSQKTVLSHTPSLAVNYNTLLCYTILAVQELTQRLIALEQKVHQNH